MSDSVEEEEDGAESPVAGCLSMKSDQSEDDPPLFSNEPEPSESKVQSRPRAESPTPSCLSMKSDWSMEKPPEFSNEPGPSDTKVQSRPRAESPVPSCLSMNSDKSMDGGLYFREKKRSHASVEELMSKSRKRPRLLSASQNSTVQSKTVDRSADVFMSENRTCCFNTDYCCDNHLRSSPPYIPALHHLYFVLL
ncbi:uncharacterized protein LOC119496458 isoform X2 [Sebastes umbrosus]|uniref:uncharacterized protein LOC119496458 isoform X2 n=1 Tax=Sebastes umbrosus TaxID=72105 RepID=UPI0018A02345|nr:uncharacterized protein LOC119496458 isoform X2 [Sebastes umbrosus]